MRGDLKLLLILLILNNLKRISIKINIVDENKTPLKNVTIYGKSNVSNEWVILNSCLSSWVYITNVPKGNIDFIICKNDYYIKTFNLCISNDCEFTICLLKKKRSRIYGIITNTFNEVIGNAIVVLYKVIDQNKYLPLRATSTDFLGEYNFIDVPEGTYIVKAIK